MNRKRTVRSYAMKLTATRADIFALPWAGEYSVFSPHIPAVAETMIKAHFEDPSLVHQT